jgi:hypothetical protein
MLLTEAGAEYALGKMQRAHETVTRALNLLERQGVKEPAAIEIHHNNPTRAITLLEATSPYELAGYGPIYVRGEAFRRAQEGAKAAAEYQKILDHRGIDPLDPVYALARLGLGRAYALQGGVVASLVPAQAGRPRGAPLQPDALGKARTAYQDFFAFWKDADPDIPVLKQAKEEYEKLR